jgi:hypothetical protein
MYSKKNTISSSGNGTSPNNKASKDFSYKLVNAKYQTLSSAKKKTNTEQIPLANTQSKSPEKKVEAN